MPAQVPEKATRMEQREGTKRAEEYVAGLGVSIKAELVKDGGDKEPSVWRCTLERRPKDFHGKPERTLLVPEYSMGAAYRTKPNMKHPEWMRGPSKPLPPDATQVLWSLISDAQCVRGDVSFENFCADLGYDTDSRKAEGIYLACRRELDELRRFGIDLDAAAEAFSDY